MLQFIRYFGGLFAVFFLTLFFYTNIFIVVIIYSNSRAPLDSLGIGLISIYWFFAILYILLLFRNEPLINSLSNQLISKNVTHRIHGILYLTHIISLVFSLYPLLLVSTFLGFKFESLNVDDFDEEDFEKIPLDKIQFIRGFTDSFILKSKIIYIITNLVFMLILFYLKKITPSNFTIELILFLQVVSVTTFTLMNILANINIRTLCKRMRGPVLLNFFHVLSFVICNGIISASIVDIAILTNDQSVIMNFLSIIAKNTSLIIHPEKILSLITNISANSIKVIFYFSIYYYFVVDLINIKGWENWKRSHEDLFFISCCFLNVKNHIKSLEYIKLAISLCTQKNNFRNKRVASADSLVPPVYYKIAGKTSLEINDIKSAKEYLDKVQIPIKFSLNGPSSLFWIYTYLNNTDRNDPFLYSSILTKLKENNKEKMNLDLIISELRHYKWENKTEII